MPTTIKAIYDHGTITPLEEPPVKDTKVEVTITFPDTAVNGRDETPKQKIILGLLEGKIRLADDFDEPMEDLKDYM